MIDVNELLERSDELLEKLSLRTTTQLRKQIRGSQRIRQALDSPFERGMRRRNPTVQRVHRNVADSRAYRAFKKQYGMTDAQMRQLAKVGK